MVEARYVTAPWSVSNGPDPSRLPWTVRAVAGAGLAWLLEGVLIAARPNQAHMERKAELQAAILLRSLCTVVACHSFPLRVGIPRLFNPSARPRSVVTLSPLSSSTTRFRSSSRAAAFCALMASALSRSASVGVYPLYPPSFLVDAASAAFVRSDIRPRSNSATAAICWIMKRPIAPGGMSGKSPNTTSTSLSTRPMRNCWFLARRSSLATTRVAW